jgi:hypothetical protein
MPGARGCERAREGTAHEAADAGDENSHGVKLRKNRRGGRFLPRREEVSRRAVCALISRLG